MTDMSETLFVKPRAGLAPRVDEHTIVGPQGAAVARTRLVRRMIAAGDLIEASAPAPRAEADKKESRG